MENLDFIILTALVCIAFFFFCFGLLKGIGAERKP